MLYDVINIIYSIHMVLLSAITHASVGGESVTDLLHVMSHAQECKQHMRLLPLYLRAFHLRGSVIPPTTFECWHANLQCRLIPRTVAVAAVDTTHFPSQRHSPRYALGLTFEPVVDARCMSTVLASLAKVQPSAKL
jgi:hypothetical protein